MIRGGRRKPLEAVKGDIRYQLRGETKQAELQRLLAETEIEKQGKAVPARAGKPAPAAGERPAAAPGGKGTDESSENRAEERSIAKKE